MNTGALIDRLEWFGAVLPAVVSGLPEQDARTRPPAGQWSVLEIVCHLVDEEVRDFRTRVFQTLDRPADPWPGIDPEGWARTEGYADRSLRPMVEAFVRERRESVRRLREIGPTDWSVAHHHPKFGPIRAGDLLASWAAHDMLHLRQIAKRVFELAGRDAPEFSTAYAGEWRA